MPKTPAHVWNEAVPSSCQVYPGVMLKFAQYLSSRNRSHHPSDPCVTFSNARNAKDGMKIISKKVMNS